MSTTQQWQDRVARRLVATVLDEGAALRRWLDVGYGNGTAVAVALDAGVERIDAVVGAPAAIEDANDRFDRAVLGVRLGTPTDLGGFVGPYDVVLSVLALDVTRDPGAALDAIREVLSYGSSGWVVVRERGDDEAAGPGVASSDELNAVAETAGWSAPRRLELEGDGPDVLVVTTGP